jgi:hypothetical protein
MCQVQSASLRMACSQKRCQIARSPRAMRVRERRSVGGTARTKRILIALMRFEKSSSPSGKVMMQCMCSSSTTQASIRKRPFPPGTPHRLAERVDISEEEIRPPFQQIDGEENRSRPGPDTADSPAQPQVTRFRCRADARRAIRHSPVHRVDRNSADVRISIRRRGNKQLAEPPTEFRPTRASDPDSLGNHVAAGIHRRVFRVSWGIGVTDV